MNIKLQEGKIARVFTSFQVFARDCMQHVHFLISHLFQITAQVIAIARFFSQTYRLLDELGNQQSCTCVYSFLYRFVCGLTRVTLARNLQRENAGIPKRPLVYEKQTQS